MFTSKWWNLCWGKYSTVYCNAPLVLAKCLKHVLRRHKMGPTVFTVILKIGTPEIITIIVLQLEQLDFTVQYCVQKMQTE